MPDLCTVDYTIGWIPTSIGLTSTDKQVLANERHVDPRKIRGSYAILGSQHKHAVIKRGLALRATLTSLRDKFLLPDVALAVSAAGKKTAVKRARSYVIDEASVAPFRQQYAEARDCYLSWGVELSSDATYSELRNLDREAIGDSWSLVEHLYPTQQALREAVYCTTPIIEPVVRGVNLAKLDPALAQQLREEAKERVAATTNSIEALLLEQFQTFIDAVRRSCGNVVRVHPSTTGVWSEYVDADVVSYKSIPFDSGEEPLCEIELRKAGTTKAQKFTMTEQAFRAELKPVETAEYRRLTDAAFSNLLDATDKIARFRNQLIEADDTEFLTAFAKDVETALRSYGQTPSSIANTLRNDTTRRDEMRKTFDGLLEQLQESGTAVRARQFSARRKIFSNLDD